MKKFLIIAGICLCSIELLAVKPWGHLGRMSIIKANFVVSSDANRINRIIDYGDYETWGELIGLYAKDFPELLEYSGEVEYIKANSMWSALVVRAGYQQAKSKNSFKHSPNFPALEYEAFNYTNMIVELGLRMYSTHLHGCISPVGRHYELFIGGAMMNTTEREVFWSNQFKGEFDYVDTSQTIFTPIIGIAVGRSWVAAKRIYIDLSVRYGMPIVGILRQDVERSGSYTMFGAMTGRAALGIGYMF